MVEAGSASSRVPERLLPETRPLSETISGDGAPRPKRVEAEAITSLGRFAIEARIGQGGMGEVFRAYDPELDRNVALKRLTSVSSDDDARIRMLREAQAIARLSHAHVVAVYDVGRDEKSGDVFIAMELIEGITLRQWLREKPRSWREVAEVFRQAGTGLFAAHRHGIVHRDFKPENVLVTHEGVAKVVDFGLAKPAAPLGQETTGDDDVRLPPPCDDDDAFDEDSHDQVATSDPRRKPEEAEARATCVNRGVRRPRQRHSPAFASDLTPLGARIGTPAYMPPEQAVGPAATPLGDQFSFAVALFEALCGYLPFPGETPAEYAIAMFEGAMLEFPRGSDVPKRLQNAIYRAIDPDPKLRFSDLAPLLDELRRDPAARRRRAAALAGAVAMGGILTLGASKLAGPNADESVATCERRLATTQAPWSPELADKTRHALGGLDAPYAADTAARTVTALDALEDARRLARTQWCVTRERHGYSDGIGAAVGGCLDRFEARERELVASLVAPDLEALSRATLAVERLGRELDHCDEPVRLVAVRHDDRDDNAWSQVVELLAKARQRLELGQTDEGLATLAEIDTLDLGDPPAILLLERGIVASGLAKQRGNTGDARSELERAAQVGLGAEAPLLAAEWNTNYADVLFELGEISAMVAPYERAWSLRRRHLGEDHIDTLVADAARGHAPYAEGNYAAALERYQAAATRAKAATDELNHDRILLDEWVAQALNHLGELERARALTEDVVTRLRRSRGDSHPRTLDVIDTLAVIELRAGQYAQALAHCNDVLARRAHGGAGDDPMARAMTMANRGAALTALQRHDEATAALREALTLIQQSGYPEDHGAPLAIEANLGSLLQQQGRLDEAITTFRDLLARLRAGGLENTSNGLMVRLNLAHALLARGLASEARPLLDRAIIDADQGGDLVLVGRLQLALARVLDQLDQRTAAEAALTAAHEALRDQGPESSWLADLVEYESAR